MATHNKMKPFCKLLGRRHTLFGANGLLTLVDPIGVCVRRFTQDKESGKWIITNSLGMWVGSAKDTAEAEYIASQYVTAHEKENE